MSVRVMLGPSAAEPLFSVSVTDLARPSRAESKTPPFCVTVAVPVPSLLNVPPSRFS